MTISDKREILIENAKDLLPKAMDDLRKAENILAEVIAKKAKAVEYGYYYVREWKIDGRYYSLETALALTESCGKEVNRIINDIEDTKTTDDKTISEIYELWAFIGIVPTEKEFDDDLSEKVWNLQHEM